MISLCVSISYCGFVVFVHSLEMFMIAGKIVVFLHAETRSPRQHVQHSVSAGRRSPRGRGKHSEQPNNEPSSDEDEEAGKGVATAEKSSQKINLKTPGKVTDKEQKKYQKQSRSEKPTKDADAQKEGVEEDSIESSNGDLEHDAESVGGGSSDSEIVFMKTLSSGTCEKKKGKKQVTATAKENERQACTSRELKGLSLWSKDKVVDGRTLVKGARTRKSKQQANTKIVDEGETSEESDDDIEQLSDDEVEGIVVESDSEIEEVSSGFHVRYRLQKSAMEATAEENLELKKAVQLLKEKLAALEQAHAKKLQDKVGRFHLKISCTVNLSVPGDVEFGVFG